MSRISACSRAKALIGIAILLAGSMTYSVARAQTAVPTVERYLPPEPPHRSPIIRIDQDLQKSDDASPLGVDLRGISLTGSGAIAKKPRASGIAVEGIEGIDAAVVASRLDRYIGQPLTRKLMSEIQAAIAAAYREAGHPFVSITVPPQEVTTGVLQLRVIAFKVGKVAVSGAPAADFPPQRIRTSPGELVDARRLETDLDWANRNPFRQVEAVFGPGKDLAQTNLTLQQTARLPWQVFGGYANSGTRLTDRDRVFVGAAAAPFTSLSAPYNDIYASFQLTSSKNFWSAQGQAFGDVGESKYFSPAARVVIPLGWRSSLELTGDFVQTNERPSEPFRIRTLTTEGAAVYRQALSDILPWGRGDLLGGIELKRQNRTTFFTGVDVADGQAEVAQWLIGWTGRWTDGLGSNSFEIRLKSNPGGVLGHNTAADWSLFTNGRVSDVRTTFATLSYNRITPLADWSLKTDVLALVAARPLPDTERIGLGGNDLVRGYVTEDGTVDQGIVMRNSLYLPSFSPSRRPGFNDTLAPFLLADVGWGRDVFFNRSTSLSSIGLGFDYRIGPNFSSTVTAATALSPGPDTPSGAWRIQARAVLSF
ncbi:ShlB/FhaC/HecB family hemolysin secretion/activation protein [Bradyrhizobium sp. HKCCYLS2038]|uniref:ShlB/FhaC/HecB family hemolysin secretion/activation protein n=1 Tax=unclassified Bradyrhizobium TaxID=2631580 RepID=UPI003EBE137A